MADDALSVEDIHGWPATNIPATGVIGPSMPSYQREVMSPLAIASSTGARFLVGYDTQKDERTTFVGLDQSAVLGVVRNAWTAPVCGKREHDDFVAIVAQAEFSALAVFADDVRCLLSDLKAAPHCKEKGIGQVTIGTRLVPLPQLSHDSLGAGKTNLWLLQPAVLFANTLG